MFISQLHNKQQDEVVLHLSNAIAAGTATPFASFLLGCCLSGTDCQFFRFAAPYCPEACKKMSTMYRTGQGGVTKDPAIATVWGHIAAVQGYMNPIELYTPPNLKFAELQRLTISYVFSAWIVCGV